MKGVTPLASLWEQSEMLWNFQELKWSPVNEKLWILAQQILQLSWKSLVHRGAWQWVNGAPSWNGMPEGYRILQTVLLNAQKILLFHISGSDTQKGGCAHQETLVNSNNCIGHDFGNCCPCIHYRVITNPRHLVRTKTENKGKTVL